MPAAGGRPYDRRVDAAPHAPLLHRLPSGAWTLLLWSATVAYAIVLFAILPSPTTPWAHGLNGPARTDWAIVLVPVTLAVPLVMVRRFPLPVFGLLLAETFGFALAVDGRNVAVLPFLAAEVALGYVAATRARRVSRAAGVTCLAVLVAFWVTRSLTDDFSLRSSSGMWALPLTIVVAWMVGSSIRQRRDYAAALRAQVAARAVTAERLQIARELHDIVAHSIGIIAIQSGAGSRVIETQPAQARNALAAIETTSRDTLAGLRRMLVALRDPAADAVDRSLGLRDLDRLTATAAEAGIDVGLAWHGQRRALPAEVDRAAYRIIQEAVTNVIRHAGTSRCQVSVGYLPDELRVEVNDDGIGGTPDGVGYGLAGMRERAAILHGTFHAGPRPEGGFRVTARLPA
jgi:signal transduction histidine kinase